MINFHLPAGSNRTLHVLCLGAHSDDIEIGCGGTLLRLARQYSGCVFHWVVFSAIGVRAVEATRAAHLFAGPSLRGEPSLKTFQDGFLPFAGGEVKAVFEELKPRVTPDIIFTHYGKDAHQDHRLVAELTWNTFRDHLILEYEIPKYDGDIGQPSVFMPLESDVCKNKVRHLMESFPSQHAKRWFQEEVFFSFLRMRGMECNAASGYAEAFHCRKMVL